MYTQADITRNGFQLDVCLHIQTFPKCNVEQDRVFKSETFKVIMEWIIRHPWIDRQMFFQDVLSILRVFFIPFLEIRGDLS